jgi:5-methylcytosine-specific restriction protein A
LVDNAVESEPEKPLPFRDVIASPASLMGVKAVFAPVSSHVLCFGGRGDRTRDSYFSVAAGAARRAVERPYIVTIGGGKHVRPELTGRVVNLARAASVFGLTSTLLNDAGEVARLSQWPVAIALHDVWEFVGFPHLVHDLGFPDRTILAGSQDGIIRPEKGIDRLWQALHDWPIQRLPLLLPANFYDSGRPQLVKLTLPSIPASSAEEGKSVWKLQRKIERDSAVAKAAKRLNRERHGSFTCEACGFAHADGAMFDAHHPTPLAVGKRTTFPEHLQILCPTCHRRAHRKSPLDPYQLDELRAWVAAARP